MSDDQAIPLEENRNARMLLGRLREGPVSTIELQSTLPLVHVARQVWELRHWYGFSIKTGRLPNGVALYSLIGRVEAVSDAPIGPICPRCGGRLHDVRQTLAAGIVNGRCLKHGRTNVRLAS